MPQPDKDTEPDERSWWSRHQHTFREWLILVVAVIAGVAGWQQIADERDARKDAEAEQEELEREEEYLERRAQADEIAVWQGKGGGDGMNVILSNSSQQPVYRAVVSRVAVEGSGAEFGREIPERSTLQEQQAVLLIPPGRTRLHFPPGFGGMSRAPGFEIAFWDQGGQLWVRYSNGALQEIEQEPIDYYGLERPVLWR